jgi:hypothetical protein
MQNYLNKCKHSDGQDILGTIGVGGLQVDLAYFTDCLAGKHLKEA